MAASLEINPSASPAGRPGSLTAGSEEKHVYFELDLKQFDLDGLYLCGGHGRTPDLPLSVTRPPWSVSAPQGGRPDAGAREGTASGGQTVSRGRRPAVYPSCVEAQSHSRLRGSWVGRTPGRGTGQEP